MKKRKPNIQCWFPSRSWIISGSSSLYLRTCIRIISSLNILISRFNTNLICIWSLNSQSLLAQFYPRSKREDYSRTEFEVQGSLLYLLTHYGLDICNLKGNYITSIYINNITTFTLGSNTLFVSTLSHSISSYTLSGMLIREKKFYPFEGYVSLTILCNRIYALSKNGYIDVLAQDFELLISVSSTQFSILSEAHLSRFYGESERMNYLLCATGRNVYLLDQNLKRIKTYTLETFSLLSSVHASISKNGPSIWIAYHDFYFGTFLQEILAYPSPMLVSKLISDS